MKTTHLLSIIFLSLVFSTCKKEKAVTAEPETSCTCLKENSGIDFTKINFCYGFLTMTNYIDLTRDFPLTFVAANAYFNNSPQTAGSGNDIISVDSVYLNQSLISSIKDVNGAHIYYQNDFSSWPSKQDWQVYGAKGIPSFSFSSDLKNPEADVTMIPDKLSKTLVKSFKINVTNATNGSATVSGSGSGYNVTVILREGENEVCFPDDQLKKVTEGLGSINVVLENTLVKNFDGKSIGFSKNLNYIKKITVNP